MWLLLFDFSGSIGAKGYPFSTYNGTSLIPTLPRPESRNGNSGKIGLVASGLLLIGSHSQLQPRSGSSQIGTKGNFSQGSLQITPA